MSLEEEKKIDPWDEVVRILFQEDPEFAEEYFNNTEIEGYVHRLLSKHFRIYKHKQFEIELIRFLKYPFAWFEISFSIFPHTDHGGITFRLELFSFYLSLDIHDDRHWNNEKKCWYVYPEDPEWPEGADPDSKEKSL